MAVQMLTPEGMFGPVPYHHVSISTGSRHVHVAGQIARDAEGNPVATGDLAGQVAHALRNTARGLAGAGASFADVVRLPVRGPPREQARLGPPRGLQPRRTGRGPDH